MEHDSYDVIVIGAGLSGLTAGITMQQAGLRVLILEQRAEAGGLCGTTNINGFEFVIACNDFGNSMEKIVQSLNVPIQFMKPKTLFYLDTYFCELPTNFFSKLKSLSYIADIIRIIRAGRKATDRMTLEELAEKYIKNRRFSDFVKSLAYPYGMAPKDMLVNTLKAEFSKKYNYGHNQPTVPIGGPKVVIEKMLQRFHDVGGVIKLNTKANKISQASGFKLVETDRDNYTTRFLISSEGRWEEYPQHCKTGMALSTFHLALKRNLAFPKNVHTIAYFPSNISSWMNKLDQGILPNELGFNFFRSDLPAKSDHYTINIYCYFPRGVDEPSLEQVNKVENFILTKTEQILPGLNKSIIFKKFISPQEFKERHMLSSKLLPYILQPGFQKPTIYDNEKDIYYIGNSVYPPGEHASGAMLSGKYAAQSIIQAASNII